MIPLTALGAVTFTMTAFGFVLYTRRTLGTNPLECSRERQVFIACRRHIVV